MYSTRTNFPVVRDMRKTIQSKMSNFTLLNIYFWMHFIGFNGGWKMESKCIFKYVISMTLAVIVETFSLFSVYIYFPKVSAVNYKLYWAFYISFTLELWLRICLYKRRRRFSTINRKFRKLYGNLTHGNFFNLKLTIFTILFLNDICDISLALVHTIIMLSNDPDIIKMSSILILKWCNMSKSVPIFFCWYCFLLKVLLTELKKIVLRRQKNEVQHFYVMYDKIIDLISLTNEAFSTLLFVTFSIEFCWTFFYSYQLLFAEKKTKASNVCHILYIMLHVSRMTYACSYSSSISKNVQEVKDLILKYPSPLTSEILYIHGKSPEFTLLDSIVVSKDLILTIFGSFITYGMLFATFQSNLDKDTT